MLGERKVSVQFQLKKTTDVWQNISVSLGYAYLKHKKHPGFEVKNVT